MNDVPLTGKTILVRADYNVPLKSDGTIADDYRLQMSLPTIKELLARHCKIIIISHLGRPDGKVDEKYSLAPVAKRLSELLKQEVHFVGESIGQKVSMHVKHMPLASVTLLENIRFHPEEEANDANFAKQLAKDTRADYLVQDCFGVAHRAHASISAIAQYLPSVAGLLLEREYTTITNTMRDPKRPLVAVLGGAKVSDKIKVIEAFVSVADTIIIGGAMANTFLNYKGMSVGRSKVEDGQKDTIDAIYRKVAEKVGEDRTDSFIVLPVDVGVGSSLEETATRQDVPVTAIPDDLMALDIGPESVKLNKSIIERAHTVVWNGTLGFAEIPAFALGSIGLAEQLADNHDIFSVIGGGDTADFITHWDSKKGGSFGHVSTGGGASLELMAGDKLPGVEVLLDAHR